MDLLPGAGDPCFVRYATATGGVLAATGAVLVPLRLWTRTVERTRGAFLAWRSWLVMAPAILLVLGLGREVFILCLAGLSLLFVREFARATGLSEDRTFVAAVCAGVLGIYATALFRHFGIFMAMPVHAVGLLFAIPVWRNEYQGMLRKVGLAAIAVVYLGWFPAHLAYLANYPEVYAYPLFLILGTELNDASAFIAGKLFGRTPLVSRISPGKTVQGTLGALVATACYVALTRRWVPRFGPVEWVLSVAVLWIGGTLGDLVISVVKRDVQVKDMGTLIPGHGGVLDRFDSLILTSPFFFHMVRYLVEAP